MDKFVVSLPGNKRKFPSSAAESPNLFSKNGNNNSSCNFSKKFSVKESKKGSGQMCLDFGQKSLGRSVTCSTCGMIYIVGDEVDEARHKKFCSSKLSITYPCSQAKRLISVGNNSNDSIIKITQQEKFNKESLGRILDVVRDEIGSEIEFLTQNSDDVIFLYLQGNENVITGVIVMEMIDSSEAVPIEEHVDISTVFTSDSKNRHHQSGNNTNNNKDSISDLNLNSFQDSTTNKRLGVKVIWVSPTSRGKRVASQLLDAARSHSSYGHVYSKNDLAFSQPTAAGKAFAFKYTFEDKMKKESSNSTTKNNLATASPSLSWLADFTSGSTNKSTRGAASGLPLSDKSAHLNIEVKQSELEINTNVPKRLINIYK